MMIADVVRLSWLIAVAWVLLRLFGAGRRGVQHDRAAAVAHLGRAVIVAVLAVNGFARLHVLNVATLLLAFGVWPLARWLKRHDWAPEKAVRGAGRQLLLEIVRRTERADGLLPLWRAARAVSRRIRAALRLARRRLNGITTVELWKLAAVVAIVAAAVDLRFAPVVGDARLGSPELYGVLLETRRALFNAPAGFVRGFSAAAATLSALGAINPMDVIRLATALIGLALMAAGAGFVRQVSRSWPAALLTLALLAPSANAAELELTLLWLILGGIALAARTPASRTGFAAALAAAVFCIPPGSPADLLRQAMPVVIAIGAGCAFTAVARGVARFARVRLEALAIPAACALFVMLMPQHPTAMYLEYGAAQRLAAAIVPERPRGRWLMVAPIEQLAEAYGRGWYEEPASFVDRFGARMGDSRFHFDFSVDEIFVFVEKRPFKTFAAEPADVPFATLTDPTYRNYRSNAGRASLEARLRRACDAYARTHGGVTVFYEDHDLAIYRFRLRR